MNMLAKRCTSNEVSHLGACLWCGADQGVACRLAPLRFTTPADLAKGKAARAPGRSEFDPARLKRPRA